MTLAVCARTLQGQNGDTLGGAEVTVRVNATGDLADIFADRDGNTPAPNPITASATGTVEFYVTPGVYRLEAIGAGGEETQVVDLGGVSVIPVATIADLQSLDTAPLPDGQQVSVAENGSTYLLDEAAGEWTRSDLDDRLGTAATADVTQSPTDTTSGRLVRVQDGDGRYVLRNPASDDDNRLEAGDLFSNSDVSGGQLGNVLLTAKSTTAAAGLVGGALAFGRPDGSSRRRGAVAVLQTSDNANQTGLVFFSAFGTTTTNDLIAPRMVMDHLGRLYLPGNRIFVNNSLSDLSNYADATADEVWHEGNTTVDGSGNIMEASPILRLYSDGLEEPNEPVGGAFARESAGVYKITGVYPLASKGWQIRTPADVNGNKLVAITEPEYDAATETLTVRTFDLLWSEGRLVPGDPMDIPEGEFVMLRFDSPEEEAA